MASPPLSNVSSTTESGAFSFGTRLGIVFIIEASFVSVVAVASLLLYILYSAVTIRKGAVQRWFLATPFHYYFLSLLASELVASTGSIMNIRWVIAAEVIEGPFCTAQGIIKQCGNVATALATLAIALHTFAVLVYRWAPDNPNRIAVTVVSGFWILVVLILGISALTHIGEVYWGDTGYWCWITSNYPVQRIALEYIFLFTAAFVNFLLYIPLALVISGKVVVEGLRFRRPSSESVLRTNEMSEGSREVKNIARQMLIYPFIYTVSTTPIAAARFSAFHGESVPYAVTVFAAVLYMLSGFFNVLLFAVTRPALLPRRENQRGGSIGISHLFDRSTNYDTKISTLSYPHAPLTEGTLPSLRDGGAEIAPVEISRNRSHSNPAQRSDGVDAV